MSAHRANRSLCAFNPRMTRRTNRRRPERRLPLQPVPVSPDSPGPASMGLSMGPPWDFVGTSPQPNPFVLGTLRKKSHRGRYFARKPARLPPNFASAMWVLHPSELSSRPERSEVERPAAPRHPKIPRAPSITASPPGAPHLAFEIWVSAPPQTSRGRQNSQSDLGSVRRPHRS